MAHSNHHGYALFGVECEKHGDRLLTRSRPLPVTLPKDEPIMNPRGVLLEKAAACLERGEASIVVLTKGTNEGGEPLLDHLGYMGPLNEPYFTDLQPVGLYHLKEAFYRVCVVRVSVDEHGYNEDTEAHEAMFLVNRQGVLQPFEQHGAVLWPQDLLDVVHDSRVQDAQHNGLPFHELVTTADDVKLDTLYFSKRTGASFGEPEKADAFDCYAVCRTTERTDWLARAKEKVRTELEAVREGIQQELDLMDETLAKLAQD